MKDAKRLSNIPSPLAGEGSGVREPGMVFIIRGGLNPCPAATW
jgi:hypothetical protein